MSRWLRLGLTDKLFFPFVCILLLSVVATAFLALSGQSKRDAERVAEFTVRIQDQWQATAHALWIKGETERLSDIFRFAVDLDTVLNSVTLTDARGRVVASSSGDLNARNQGLMIQVPVSGPDNQVGRLEAGYALELGARTGLDLITSILLTGLVTIIIGAFVYMKVLDIVLLKRIRSASDAATAIAAHDLGLRLDDRGEDELAVLAGAFNTMTDNLGELIGRIQSVTDDIDLRAAGIMAAVEWQSKLSTTQSDEVTRISSTMSAMADQTKRISHSAHEVVKIADDTQRSSDLGVNATDEGRRLMDQIASVNNERVEQIGELKRRASQIGDVMQFIEQIADQTKLIAFNASIEAAGAGEMGRRFEVVAREIRRLAENVSESAGQIRTRITDIQQAIERLAQTSVEESNQVRLGSDSSLHTVAVLHDIRSGSNKTTQSVQEISDAIYAQDAASAELVSMVGGIDANAQQLKQGLGDLVGIASDLKKLSGNLKGMSVGFVLDGRRNDKA